MNQLLPLLAALFVYAHSSAQPNNTLTAKEARQGWVLLFDGKSLNGWQSLRTGKAPLVGWSVEDGVLSIAAKSKAGDIVTTNMYGSFDLRFDFKLSAGANSGVKYFVAQGKDGKISNVACEFQLLDDNLHPDAKLGRDGNRKCGSLYDIKAAPADKKIDYGGWNTGRIVVEGNSVTHYLNGKKVVEYERGSKQWGEMVAGSKFKDNPLFGAASQGHILLQEHDDNVQFRDIKIKELK